MTVVSPRPFRRVANEYGILETLAATDRFRTFIAAVAAASMTAELAAGDLTVFAPSDCAFERLPTERLLALFTDQAHLRTFLHGHLVRGLYRERDLIPFTRLPTLAGTELSFSLGEGDVLVDGVGIVTTDILSVDGVVHELDGLMLV